MKKFMAAWSIFMMMGMLSHAEAGFFSFRGEFEADDTVQLFNFTLNSTSNVTLQSFGYGGGVQADGNVVSAGGFDPILYLFDSSGNVIDFNDDGGFPAVNFDPTTGSSYDVYMEILGLAAGDYIVALSQYDNFLNGGLGGNLSDGFAFTGDPEFTQKFTGNSSGKFWDVDGFARNGEFAFDIIGVDSASLQSVPEPSSLALVTLGLASAGVIRRKRRNQANA
ncbi:hypothetical protein KOR42_30540 [Thalassoglobus neptunius]|uniref:Ice-binding protein C-terminal domain-containing protein n=1 Tax=Thalassoglobus neptunius TaxID=1938619 RepID=A0A5C5WMX6_9PLAN|nr:DVUA0089 family protein [Thalassoglobus neptunius]TWT52186.1 hypothetical protein KOR42_30540 [Thalassoglobus neptunius]